MDNNDKKQGEETIKKAWIAPEMEEVNVNSGAAYFTKETLSYMS